jgi:hypothetical protein
MVPVVQPPPAAAAEPGSATVTVRLIDDAALADNPKASTWGKVTSEPAGIDCPGAPCAHDFPIGSRLALTVTPTPGYAFGSWGVTGADTGTACDTARVCALTVGPGAVDVVATLRPATRLFAIPEGAGTLTIDPGEDGAPVQPCTVERPLFGDLPLPCSPRYPTGTSVRVTAVPDPSVPGARFVRWSDYRCPRSASCTLRMRGDMYLTAFFSPVYLTVQAGAFGPVELPGHLCGFMPGDPLCQYPYPLSAKVTLRRDPAKEQPGVDPGFGNQPCAVGACEWTGSCTGAGGTCKLTMLKDEFVRAGTDRTADAPTRTGDALQIQYQGRRGGTITIRGPGSRQQPCPVTCSVAGYRRGDRVSVAAASTRRARFVRWSDAFPRRTRSVVVGDLAPPLKAIFR